MQDPASTPPVAPSSLNAPSADFDRTPEHAAAGFALFHAALLPDAVRFLDANALADGWQFDRDVAAGLVASLMVRRGGAFPDRDTAWHLLDIADQRILQAKCIADASLGKGALLHDGTYWEAGEPIGHENDPLTSTPPIARAA